MAGPMGWPWAGLLRAPATGPATPSAICSADTGRSSELASNTAGWLAASRAQRRARARGREAAGPPPRQMGRGRPAHEDARPMGAARSRWLLLPKAGVVGGA